MPFFIALVLVVAGAFHEDAKARDQQRKERIEHENH